MHAIYLATGASYATFADAAHVAFVRTAWHSIVAPHQTIFIGLLILFEAVVGVLVLMGISDGHREAIEPVLAGHGLAVLIERPDGTLEAVGAPDVAAALLEELVARQVAARSPGGTLTLT